MFLDPRTQNIGRTNPANVDFTVGLNALVLAQLLHDAYLQRRCWRTKRRDVLFNPTRATRYVRFLAGGRLQIRFVTATCDTSGPRRQEQDFQNKT